MDFTQSSQMFARHLERMPVTLRCAQGLACRTQRSFAEFTLSEANGHRMTARTPPPLQKQTEEDVRAPAVVLLRAAGPDDEPQPVSREGSRCATCSCSFFLSHHLPTPRSPPGMAWVTLKLVGLSVTRYGSQGTEG